jgi:hypothetical protein
MTQLHKIWILAVLSAVILGRVCAQQPALPIPESNAEADSDEKIVQPPHIITPIHPTPPSNPGGPRIYRCTVQVDIDANGVPQGTRVVRCSDPEYARIFQKAISESKFTPAVTQSGKHVATSAIVLGVKIGNESTPLSEVRVRYSLSTPSGTQTGGPDVSGVYPLTKLVTKPSLIRFSDKGYGDAAYYQIGSSPCDLLLTIDAHGKVLNPVVLKCADPRLEKPVVESLNDSKFNPGKLNGKPVPIRLQLHLEFDDFIH